MAKRKKKKGHSRQDVDVANRAQVGLKENSGWIPPATGMKINTLVSVLLALFVGWQTFQQTGDVAVTLRLALVAGGSIWLVFILVLTLTKLLRRS